MQMCLKKTSWYSFIYPMRVGRAGSTLRAHQEGRVLSLGWYVGAAFQMQDDILNLTADYGQHGKEIAGALWEGKRTLILIHARNHWSSRERARLRNFLATPRLSRFRADVDWVYYLFLRYKSINYPRRQARQLAGGGIVRAGGVSRKYRTPKKSASSWR
jgi:geranylgeranyl diphosphate synthase type II